jgi:hypothetical protein
MNPWERSIDIISQTLIAMPTGGIGVGRMTAGGLLFALEGTNVAAVGWLWPGWRLSMSIVGVGTMLSAARVCVWLVQG